MFSRAENFRISTPEELGNNLIGNKFMHGMMDMFGLIDSHADGLTKTLAWARDGGKMKCVRTRQHEPRCFTLDTLDGRSIQKILCFE